MKFVVIFLTLIATMHSAEAKHGHHRQVQVQPCSFFVCAQEGGPTANSHSRYGHTAGAAEVIGGRPSGCPHAFCGCGLSLHLFGRIIPELNLAWNWAVKFPRTSPAPGMAAVRRHHVMGLESHVRGNIWIVYDANSGGHATRLHERSIAGYVIVNPHASRYASM